MQKYLHLNRLENWKWTKDAWDVKILQYHQLFYCKGNVSRVILLVLQNRNFRQMGFQLNQFETNLQRAIIYEPLGVKNSLLNVAKPTSSFLVSFLFIQLINHWLTYCIRDLLGVRHCAKQTAKKFKETRNNSVIATAMETSSVFRERWSGKASWRWWCLSRSLKDD